MLAFRKTRTKYLTGIAVSGLVLAIALSRGPATAGASAIENSQAMTASINVPLNEIQDGQFCQAYANVYNYSGTLTFHWDGQFDNSDGAYGPLGQDQIVNGYISSSRPQYLDLTVISSAGDTAIADRAYLNIGTEFNDDCEA